MAKTDLKKILIDLRKTEMETREQVLKHLSQIHNDKTWRMEGYRSLSDYCEQALCYGPDEAREVLVQMGLILPSRKLVSDNRNVQKRIDALKEWRKSKADKLNFSAFRIFTNRTLMELAENKPKDLEDLSQIAGMGPYKTKHFGSEILKTLSRV